MPLTDKPIPITGATGSIGGRLVPQLLELTTRHFLIGLR
jgi:FlaA1/EpsC-like NDP-sugar epimerase